MQIKVSDIPEEGLAVEFTEPAGALSGLGDDMTAASDASADFTLKKVGPTVFLKGTVKGTLDLTCSRCGRDYGYAVDAALSLDINSLDSLGDEEEKELRAGDMEVEFYTGDTLDLSGVLKEQLILQAPMKPLCSEGCLGLCQYCGQDLNIEKCACAPPIGHIGLAALGELLKDKEDK